MTKREQKRVKAIEKFFKSEKDRLYAAWRESGMDLCSNYQEFCINYLLTEKFIAQEKKKP